MPGKEEAYKPGEEMEMEEMNDFTDRGYGKPLQFDPKFRGPISKRSCTDIICCFIFMVFVVGMAVVGYFAFSYGDPRLLLYPMNSDKQLCGYGEQKGKNNLLFYDLLACGKMGAGVFVDGCPTTQICVEECPTKNVYYKLGSIPGADVAELRKFCKTGFETGGDLDKYVKNESCPAYILESKPILHRCVPKVLADLIDEIGSLESNLKNASITTVTDKNGNDFTQTDIVDSLDAYGLFLKAKEYGEKVIQDVVASWWMILVGYLLAMTISLLWIILMRWIAGVMVWLTLFLFVAVFGFSSFWCMKEYFGVKDTEQSFHIHMAVLTFTFSKEKFWLGFGILSIAILAIVLLILLILCQRIRIAIALIKESSRAVGSMLMTLIFPVFIYVLEVAIIAYWLLSSVYLASSGREPTFDLMNGTDTIFSNGSYNYDVIKRQTGSLFEEIPCDNEVNTTLSELCGVLKHAQEGKYTIYLQIYNLFMLFWLVNFCIALGEMALAGAFASYYWAFEKPRDIPTFPLLNSVGRCFRYHLGSLAFGSLIVAIIQIIRVFLEYLDHKLKGSENPVASFIMKCLKCCFWCLEKFIRFLNRNAYIMVAIHGKNFCSSAKTAFLLIMRNVVRVLVVDKVVDFLLFVGKLLVVGGVACASYFFFDGQIEFLKTYQPSLNFYVVPVVLVTIGSYVVASCFFSVYNMAVDTLFLCFLEDLERNDGSDSKPYFMPKNLMKILGKKNQPTKPE
ncbi:choline transporter-like protein 2 isoform X2 [Mya arenaria]|uniref:choline transporter-like protein 2 isoform X2 n=1 Tax=Mya arenaria TaxID=6604 RepID=UPI0022E76B80|nr:choline transporter-like protein 2 isoform X2 [Mya arenaria]XP_052789291.1 choline transporter-like protein 2 isoform X2 [Mya arenaria]XP_052789292.1 choline transporter-like protein 2 isoform X2 [Mya arenaria]XP_052789293.1 choline transporter-like protein 2 isoform X2 [Mya arenaria]XP_052789294.1 choline transporter-like protein 2 isoform X2 [Mya arenaria]